jgi:hypothetical protein
MQTKRFEFKMVSCPRLFFTRESEKTPATSIAPSQFNVAGFADDILQIKEPHHG